MICIDWSLNMKKKKNLNIAQANYSNRFKWIAPTANNKFDFNNIVQTQL